MRKIISIVAIVAMFSISTAYAGTAKKPHTSQQNRMKACAAQYHEKKIAKSEYRKFMTQCLKTKKTSK